MVKEEKLVFHRVFLAVIFIFSAGVIIFFYKYGNFNKGLTGLSIKETFSDAYTNLPQSSKIFLVIQWGILIFVLIFSYIKDKKIILGKNELAGIDLKKMSEKQGTDLDTLYNLLQTKKKLNLSTISRVFNIDEEVAIEWCKILEYGNLAVIDYSAGSPLIRLNE